MRWVAARVASATAGKEEAHPTAKQDLAAVMNDASSARPPAGVVAGKDRRNNVEQQMQSDEQAGLLVQSRQAAQGLVEYGLAIGVVGVLAIAALQRWGTDIGNLFDRLGNLIRPVGGG